MEAFSLLSRTEGIIPAIESAHALAGALTLGRELGPDAVILVNLSGRGDKDVETASTYFGVGVSDRAVRRARQGQGRRAGRTRSATCRSATRPSTVSIDAMRAMVAGGVDIVEVGVPYSDPVMDGPTIQAAAEPAVRAGVGIADALRAVAAVARRRGCRGGHDLLESGRALRRRAVRR